MEKDMSTIREKLDVYDDKRNAFYGEASGKGYLGKNMESPVINRRKVHQKHKRCPEKDTELFYCFEKSAGRYVYVLKKTVDNAKP